MKINNVLQAIKYNWLQKKLEEFHKCKIRDQKIKFLLEKMEELDNAKKVVQIFIWIFATIISILLAIYIFKKNTYLWLLGMFSAIIFGIFLLLHCMILTFTKALFEHDDIKDLYKEIEKDCKDKK